MKGKGEMIATITDISISKMGKGWISDTTLQEKFKAKERKKSRCLKFTVD